MPGITSMLDCLQLRRHELDLVCASEAFYLRGISIHRYATCWLHISVSIDLVFIRPGLKAAAATEESEFKNTSFISCKIFCVVPDLIATLSLADRMVPLPIYSINLRVRSAFKCIHLAAILGDVID